MRQRDITTPNVFNKIRHWPLRPEFNHADDHKIDKLFHTEFVNDTSPIKSLCAPRRTFSRKKHAVLRCGKGDNLVKCGGDGRKLMARRACNVVERPRRSTPVRSQTPTKRRETPRKLPPSQMNKKSVGRITHYNKKSSLGLDYDTLEDIVHR